MPGWWRPCRHSRARQGLQHLREVRCPMLTHYDTVLSEQTGQQSGTRLLLGVGAIVVDAIRTGRDVVISDARSAERLTFDVPADCMSTDCSVVRWYLDMGRRQT